MGHAAEVGPGGQDHGGALHLAEGGRRDARDPRDAVPVRFREDRRDLALDQAQIRRLLEGVLHERGVFSPVGLYALGADGGAFALVERPGLEGGAVGDIAHFPAHRVDLEDEVAFSGPADGGIAGHIGNGVEGESEESGGKPRPRAGKSGFASRVSRSRDDYVKVQHRVNL